MIGGKDSVKLFDFTCAKNVKAGNTTFYKMASTAVIDFGGALLQITLRIIIMLLKCLKRSFTMKNQKCGLVGCSFIVY